MNARRICTILIAVLYSAWAVTSVSAHALLLRSNPQANAVLAQSPVQVELYFSESVEPTLSSIKVYDAGGLQVDIGDVRVDFTDPTRMTVSLHTLADGVYTVTWKSVSAIDGHQTTGSFPFAVGNANTPSLPVGGQTTSSSLPFSELVAKWLLLASLALLIGQFPFVLFVWNPALKLGAEEAVSASLRPKNWTTLYWFGLVGTLLAFVLGVLAQAGQGVGSELAFPWSKETIQVLTGTRLGVIWLTRLALVLTIIWLTQSSFAAWKRWVGFVLALALLLTVSLTSHAATEALPVLPVLDDWLHLIGMSFWLGGLAYLLTGLRQIQTLDGNARTRLTSLIMTRFSMLALASVAVIGMTGMYSAFLRVGSVSALLTSLYGHALLLKQVFVALLLCLAAFNLLVITPRLKRDLLQGTANPTWVSRFGRMVLAEVILAGLLLASVSFLTYLPPAKVASVTRALTGAKKVDDLEIDISISPGSVGQNTFKLQLASNGEPVPSVKDALLRFTPDQSNIPPSEIQLIGQGNGTFMGKGANLSLPANWQVQAVVRRENKFDAYANFNFRVRTPGSAEDSSAIPRAAGAMIIIIGLLIGLNMVSLKEDPAIRFGMGSLVTILVLTIGAFYLTRPVAGSNGEVNPIPPNKESVAGGQALFTVNCVPCHGVGGKGDGPVGLTLNPRPADLTLHAVPGVHTDAQLYEWISDGFPGSRMPAFRSVLSDTDRWNLVNFIRTLAPK